MTRRRVTDEQYGRLARRVGELQRRVDEGAIPFQLAMDDLQRIIQVVTVTIKVGDDRSTEELLKAGGYDYLKPRIMELCPKRSLRKPGTIVLEEIEFDDDWSHEEGIAELKRRGLQRMEWDDLLLLLEQYPDCQRKLWMVSSMEPIEGYVLCAPGASQDRNLVLDNVQLGWPRYCRLLGVREPS
jgi:hypothetical protein